MECFRAGETRILGVGMGLRDCHPWYLSGGMSPEFRAGDWCFVRG